jgi:HK97 family phage major capsid protein
MLIRKIERRSMPSLLEQRNNLITEAEGLVKSAKTETRAMNEGETSRFEQIQNEIKQIDKTIAAETISAQMSEIQGGSGKAQAKMSEEQEKRALEEDKFLKYLKGDTRALDVANNGVVIPETISNQIITRVKELSPIYQRATVFNVGGDLSFPAFDSNSIVTAYVADLQELTAQNGNFTSRKLQNFIAGSLVILSRSLLNRSDFALVNFASEQMSQSISRFIERELLVGVGVTGATGIFSDANVTSVAPAGTTFGADDLISQQMSIPEQFQPACTWIMNKSTFTGLRKLKDANGNYLLNRDITGPFGWEILGRPVFVSENAPTNSIAYGDYAGLYVKLAQNVEMQILNEKYATQHATGVVGYIEFDSRVIEDQRISIMELPVA